MNIKTAVIIAAGDGRRLMPLTLMQSKALLPVADRPALSYILDDLVASGIRHVVFVVSAKNHEQFRSYGKYLQATPSFRRNKIKFGFVIQKKLTGSAEAVMCAKKFVKNAPFLAYSCDYILSDSEPSAKKLIKIYNKTKSMVVMLEKISPSHLSNCATTSFSNHSPGLYNIKKIIEKPHPKEFLSPWNPMPFYLLTPAIFPVIKAALRKPWKRSEVAVVEAINRAIGRGANVVGWKFKGTRFDTGSVQGLLEANVYFGLKHPGFKKEFRAYLHKQLQK